MASILLAFSIEAWWSNKQYQSDEQVVLEALLNDVERLQGVLDQNVILTDVLVDSATALLQMASIASAHQPTQVATSVFTSSQPASQPLGGINVAPQGERPSAPTSSLPLKKRDPMHNDDGAT